jgi:hypothetical protein
MASKVGCQAMESKKPPCYFFAYRLDAANGQWFIGGGSK